mgnify:CR=1 FL=1
MSITSQDETSRTAQHRRVERILARMQIGFDSEVGFSPYSVDIYIPEWHLAVEVDGPGHSPKKDAERDAVLLGKYFLPVLRLKSDLPGATVITKIEDFIILHAGTGSERKRQYTEKM